MSELNEVFADVKVEGADPFKDIIVEPNKESTPAESQPEKVEEGTEPVQGEQNTESKEDMAFHKRWAEREAKLKAEWDEKLQTSLETQRQEFESKIPKSESKTNIPEWFVELYGENERAWEKYNDYDKTRRDEIKREVIESQEAARREAAQEDQKWTNWVDSQMAALESKGLKFDRQGLADVILNYKPTDANNNYDFEAGYRIYELLNNSKQVDNSEKSQARKRIADISTKSSNVGESKKDYVSSADIRKKNWSDL